jgi:hypothetical protein
MMGRLNHDQQQLFYSFHLDEAIPHDHPVREIASVLDLSWVHSELAPFYPKMGRPSIDPELMIRMGKQFDATIPIDCNLDAPPIRQNAFGLLHMSLADDQIQKIKNATVQIDLMRQSLQRVPIALKLVSTQGAVDNRNVDPNRSRPHAHLFDHVRVVIVGILGCKPSLRCPPNV